LEVGSIILQLFSKKFRGKKIFRSTPIHHHLEAVGWAPEKITMRFWIIGVVLALIGVAIRLLG
jgi:phospho-N-acetylmuramoyl-pentapeptide-transferase